MLFFNSYSLVSRVVRTVCFSLYILGYCIGNGNSRFPFCRWESHGNENGRSVVRKRHWKLSYGNRRE